MASVLHDNGLSDADHERNDDLKAGIYHRGGL